MSEALMRRWFDEVWNKGSESGIDEMLAQDCVIHGLTDLKGRPVPAREAFRDFYRSLRSQFSALTITVQSSTANADGTTTSQCLVAGTHKASGKPVKFHGEATIRVTNGKISEARNKFDLDEIEKQVAG